MGKNSKKPSINRIGIYILVICFVLLILKFLPFTTSLFSRLKIPMFNNIQDYSDFQSTLVPTSYTWREQVKEEFRLAYKVPPMLLSTDYQLPDKYIYFVRHEETNESVYGKGVAVGVAYDSVEEEADYIIESIAKQSNANYTRKQIEIRGFSAVRIDYEKIEDFEARSIVVVNNQEYTFSFSTTVDQIDKLIESIRFY